MNDASNRNAGKPLAGSAASSTLRPEDSLLVPLQFEVSTGRIQTIVVHAENVAAELF